MHKLKDCSVSRYLELLSQRTPTPGGGSAAALVGALGAALLAMVTSYSIGRDSSRGTDQKLQTILKESKKFKAKFCKLIDLDAQAYLKVVKTRKGSKKAKQKALQEARAIPAEVAKLCSQALDLAPFLVKYGNKYLVSDVVVAAEFFCAAFRSAIATREMSS